MLDVLLASFIRHPRRTGSIGLMVAAAALAVLWWLLVWQSPQRAFEDMLANNLTAVSVTKREGVQAQNQGVEQYVQLQMGGSNAADWLVVAKQADSSATTESIGTPTTGFVRYTDIVNSKADAKRHFDFSKIINVWGKSDSRTDPSLDHLFAQTLLDISDAPLPPIANLPDAERGDILTFLRTEHIFAPSYSSVKRETVAGRKVYTYSVSVKLNAYVRMMQAFSHDVGLHSLDTVDPSQYASAPPVKLNMSVDRASHQLVQVTYPGSQFAERYADWGILTPITIPDKAIPTTELQTRIQALIHS